MKLRHALGYAMLTTPFVVIFIAAALSLGWLTALGLFAVVFIIYGCPGLGAWLSR